MTLRVITCGPSKDEMVNITLKKCSTCGNEDISGDVKSYVHVFHGLEAIRMMIRDWLDELK